MGIPGTIAKGLFIFGAVATALYAIVVYDILEGPGVIPMGTTVSPGMQTTFPTEKAAIIIHATFAAICLAISPFQAIPYFRLKNVVLHRWLGRIYYFSSFVGGGAAFACAVNAQGGATGRSGFFALASCWTLSNIGGLISILLRRYQLHEHIMQISVALCFAAVTLRMYLPIAIFTDFDYAYGIIAWMCWIPNILAVEILRYYYRHRDVAEEVKELIRE